MYSSSSGSPLKFYLQLTKKKSFYVQAMTSTGRDDIDFVVKPSNNYDAVGKTSYPSDSNIVHISLEDKGFSATNEFII